MFWRAVARLDESSPQPSVFDRSQGPHAAGSIEGVSFSGNERNNLMLNVGAERFANVSGISGMDHPADGRAMSLLDYDRDGWVDFAVVNANAPSLQLFRNRIGEVALDAERRRVLALRFVGANRDAAPTPGKSARDGYGAVVEVDLGDVTLVREHRAGEGFSSQNSATMLVGLGVDAGSAELRVRWPSGGTQSLAGIPADSLVTVYEDPAESPDGSGFAREPYRVPGLAARAKAAGAEPAPQRSLALARSPGIEPAKVRVFTTMATWCETCKGELPQIATLRQSFSEDELSLIGVPVDEDDTASKLDEYREQNRPAYRLLAPLPEAERAAVQQAVIDELRVDVLPATIVTDAEGRVIRTSGGVPSVSELRAILRGES